MQWYLQVLKKYADFQGRARRKEYWMFFLVNVVIGFVLGMMEAMLGIFPETDESVLGLIYCVGILVPSLAVGVRRLHDIGRTGWWLFFALIPLIGSITLLVFFVREGEPELNQYGPSPKWALA